MKRIVLLFLIFVFCTVSCDKKTNDNQLIDKVEETYSSGKATVYVEESVLPLFEELSEVFTAHYPNARLKAIPMSENKILHLIQKDSIHLAFLPKKLSDREIKSINNTIVPKQTALAKDAIIFVAHKNYQANKIKYNEVIEDMKQPKMGVKYVFDNINSNISNLFRKQINLESNTENVYFLKDAEAVAKYVLKNHQSVGVVGINWLMQNADKYADELKTIPVYNPLYDKSFVATQATISEETYPLIREIYMIDIQGKYGLGQGFSTFAAGDIGQRVVLKSGLMPIKTPPRQINLVNETK